MSLDTVRLFRSRHDQQPLEILTREQARSLKSSGEAYFCNHGRDMCLNAPRPEALPEMEEGSMSNWRTIRESKLPVNVQKRCKISSLRVTTKQFVTPREPKAPLIFNLNYPIALPEQYHVVEPITCKSCGNTFYRNSGDHLVTCKPCISKQQIGIEKAKR